MKISEDIKKQLEEIENVDDSHSLYEMALVGKTDNNIEIRVYGTEGFIPHFHFRHVQSKRKGCIRLDKPKYVKHQGNDDTLNSSEVDSLIDFLNAENKDMLELNIKIKNYNYLCVLWNQNNPDKKIDFNNIEQPDYSKL